MNKPNIAQVKERLHVFDLLRGFFIVVIIIDHLQRWPGIFDWITGQGRLWASAAGGFILVSGIMIGLIRGYKSKSRPMKEVTHKLLSRSLRLYLWAVLMTVLSLFLVLILPEPIKPFPPGIDSFSEGSALYLLWQILTFQATYGWCVFLMLYAVFLAFSPFAVYLLRNNKWWVLLLISAVIWAFGFGKENIFLGWQFLFFIGAVIGYYYYPLRENWKEYKYKRVLKSGVLTAALITLVASAITIFAWPIVKSDWSPVTLEQFLRYREVIDPYFIRDEMRPLHISITLLWFGALYIIFRKFEPMILKYLGWLLLPFGRHSLFVYILQGVVVIFIAALIPQTSNIFINAFITLATIALLWALTTKVKWLHKIIPS